VEADNGVRRSSQKDHGSPVADLISLQIETVRAEIPEYARIPVDELRADTLLVVRAAARSIREDRPPSPDELQMIGRIGAHRALQGVPLHAMISACKVAIPQGDGPELRVDPKFWKWLVETFTVAAEEHRRTEMELTRNDRDQRTAFLHALFSGGSTAGVIEEAAVAFGLDPHGTYLAFRACATDAEARQRIMQACEGVGFVAAYRGDLAGIVTRRPTVRGDDLIALGRALPLTAAAASFNQASMALKVAVTFGIRGVVTIADVPLHATVLANDELSDLVVERCFGAIPRSGRQRETLEATLTAYLDHDLNIRETAETLHVHPNTLRYRLRRFEDTSSLSFERIEHLVTIWWALRRLQITRFSGG